MTTLELFSGTKSFSKVAKEFGHSTFTIDNDRSLDPDFVIDIMDITPSLMLKHDIIWASPPCEGFSVASIGKSWIKTPSGYVPKSDTAIRGLMMLYKTISIIEILKPKYWFIENPRGMMRKMTCLQHYHRKTVTYCQYGDTRMKPTDIWTNFVDWQPKPPCKNGSPCHTPAPRGSRTGTQGLKNAKDRGVIPRDLFIEIFNLLED